MKRIYQGLRRRKINWLMILVVILSSFTIDQITVGRIKNNQSPEKSAYEKKEARVVKVIDGDTIEIDSGQRVRYLGIDTPEISHYPDYKPDQCFAAKAKEANKRMVLNKKVYLEKDVSDTDKYGRLLRYVWRGDRLINLELVKGGFARVATFPPDVKYQKQFLQAERRARESGLGLWGECD